MAISTDITLTGVWQRIATAGEVMFTPTRDCEYRITHSTTAPTETGGHIAQAFHNEAMTLAGSENLWVLGGSVGGTITVVADAPVTP